MIGNGVAVAECVFCLTRVEIPLAELHEPNRCRLPRCPEDASDGLRLIDHPTLTPSLLDQWRTPRVQAIARWVRGAGSSADLAVLADALEDAGCDHPDLLAHLRGGGEHLRGCWAVDLLLGNGF